LLHDIRFELFVTPRTIRKTLPNQEQHAMARDQARAAHQ
jgi:hypothetical protein